MLFMCQQLAQLRENKQKAKESARQSSVIDSKLPIIWVLGGPGSGKRTQCERIVAKYKFSHLIPGDLLKAEVASGSPKGRELIDTIIKGQLVSNEVVLELLDAAMGKAQGATGFLIDGYPREKDNGPAFEKAIAPVDLILYFECSNETLVARILKRDADSEIVAYDNEQTLRTRIATFRENIEEIIVQYPTLISIDADRDVEPIFAEVIVAIDEILRKKSA